MKSVIFVPVKYGLLAGLLVVCFAILKYVWLLNQSHPDLYITLVAICFTIGGVYVARLFHQTHSNVVAIGEPDFLNELSKREKEVLCLLTGSLTNKEIAEQLHISPSTLKTHINHIYHKAGIQNRKQLNQILKSTLLNKGVDNEKSPAPSTFFQTT